MKEELKNFGLTENEARVYLAIVEIGEATTTPIRKKTDIHMSRVYEALNSLVEKGLVSDFLKNNVKHFKAADPDVMFDILDERKEELAKIIPQIKILKEKKKENYNVSIYEGYKALKQLYEHILFSLDKKDEILVLGASAESMHFLSQTFFKQYSQEKIKKKVKTRFIFNHDAYETAKEYDKMPFNQARILPKGTVVGAVMDIYPDKTSILLLKEKPIIFHIECKEVADSYRKYFEFLWQMAKPTQIKKHL